MAPRPLNAPTAIPNDQAVATPYWAGAKSRGESKTKALSRKGFSESPFSWLHRCFSNSWGGHLWGGDSCYRSTGFSDTLLLKEKPPLQTGSPLSPRSRRVLSPSRDSLGLSGPLKGQSGNRPAPLRLPELLALLPIGPLPTHTHRLFLLPLSPYPLSLPCILSVIGPERLLVLQNTWDDALGVSLFARPFSGPSMGASSLPLLPISCLKGPAVPLTIVRS